MPLPKVTCVKCGKCCRSYYIPFSEEDIFRWSIQFRNDILEHISAGDSVFTPVIFENDMQCPFLKKLTYDKTCVCCIHNTKPEACRAFPISLEQAQGIQCPGLED